MIRYRRRYWVFAALLSMLAGYADANAFVHLGGFFVSFMSGNSTRLGVGIAQANGAAPLASGLIALFVIGVMLGSFLNARADKSGGVRVLAFVSGLLVLASALASFGMTAFAIAGLALGMGAMNAVFQRDGEVSIGVTYMTGTLVRLGQRLSAALRGGPRWDWIPYLLLWSGLVVGATLGAIGYAAFGLRALWAAAIVASGLTLLFVNLRDEPSSR